MKERQMVRMSIKEYNEKPVIELLRLHEEEHYTFIIKNGRIVWVSEGS